MDSMTKGEGIPQELLVSVANNETRVGLLEKGLLQEIYLERSGGESTVGNIYKGKVVRILSGMQSAFVDIGQNRAAFMHISDMMNGRGAFEDRQESQSADISELLYEGQELLVQVTKEPIDNKGARITTSLSIASRFLVYLPGTQHIGISQKIDIEAERHRLNEIVDEVSKAGEGFVIRTAAEGVGEAEIIDDAGFLRTRWKIIQADAGKGECPRLIYEDLPLPLRVMRDVISSETASILVDDKPTMDIIRRFLADFIPEKLSCLRFCDQDVVLFDRYQIDDQIEAALNRQIALKSGGYLIIDQTEAMTTIDVNTGGFVGGKDLEDTIYRTNLEASAVIPRQLRLRNLGGIIIIDFIDMIDEEHKRQVLRVLEKGIAADKVKCNLTQISELGLVEMTRKRTYSSLLKKLCEPCEVCDGRGFIKSLDSVCFDIFKDLKRKSEQLEGKQCLIMASQTVIDHLLDEQVDAIRSLCEAINVTLSYQVEPGYFQEQFDIVTPVSERG